MSKSRVSADLRMLAASCSFLASAAGVASAQTAAPVTETPDQVIVTGTRERSLTQFTSLAPVDVLPRALIRAGSSDQLQDQLAQLVPSFDVKQLPTSDGLQFVRPAALNNLSPDMTLLLVNGKRFHRSAFLGTNGSEASDLAQISTYAIGRVEVLRDGASAQYGSDAIAGVINVILDTQPGFGVYAQGSQFYAGDGAQAQVGAHAGLALPGGGHFALTAEYSHADPTSRTIQRPDAIAFQAANPTISVADPVQRWGDPKLETTRLAVDTSEPVGVLGAEIYGFLNYSQGQGVNDINWRNPSSNASIYKTTSVFPGFNLNTIYPAGFTPHEGIQFDDIQAAGGVRQTTSDVFTWDLSGSYGRNSSNFLLNNSINASLGPQSPKSFNLGTLEEEETDVNLDAVYKLHLPFLARPVNVGFGGERRLETYTVVAGDPASYAVGPGAIAGLAPASNGFPGFNLQQAGSLDQQSYGGYIDVQADLTTKWNVEAAGRIETYDSFGDTENVKIASRYEFIPGLALRGSYSTGFRAPTPGQLFSTSTSQGLDTVTLQLFTNGRLSPLNPVAQALGAKPLQPETSGNYTAGLVWRSNFGLTGSIDGYQIDVANRFSTSATIVVTPALQAQLVAQGVAAASAFTSINYFTNDFDTRTRGVDIVLDYLRRVGPGHLDVRGAYNYNDTTVTRGSLTANPTTRILFEEGVPQQNATITSTYDVGRFTFLGRMRYYGSWTDSTGNATGDIFQNFGGVAFFDASVTVRLPRQISLRVGAQNLFDTYPDKATYQASRGLVYSRNSPYDTDGGQYYVRMEARF